VSQPTILIISDETDYAPNITARWQTERVVPAFQHTTTQKWAPSLAQTADVAIIVAARARNLPHIFADLEAAAKPALYLVGDSDQLSQLRNSHPRLMLLREHEGWLDALVLLAGEIIRRLDATSRAQRAEQSLAEVQAHATLGRYMLEMRHNFNNALTSVLGNSELLLLEPGAFSADVRDQLSTIHTMALRIHDILQRFSSLELEMKFAINSHPENPAPAPTLVSASKRP
jgi:signal transduction histidine kinase